MGLNILLNQRSGDFNEIERLALRIKGEKPSSRFNLDDPENWTVPLIVEGIGLIMAETGLPPNITCRDQLQKQGYGPNDIAFYYNFTSMFRPGRDGRPSLRVYQGFEASLEKYLSGETVAVG